MENDARICVEMSPGIGDLIMMTPALRSIKEQYPNIKITVLSTSQNSLCAVERLPYVNKVCAIPQHGGTLAQKLYAMNVVAHQDYVWFDACRLNYFWMAKLFGVHHRIGQCKEKYKKYGLLTKYHPYGKDYPKYFKAQCLADRLAADLDIDLPIDNQCNVSKPNNEEKNAAILKLRNKGWNDKKEYIIISPFGNSDFPLPYELIKETIDYILEHYDYDCVIIDAKAHNELYQLDGRRVFNMCGQTTLMEMIALIEYAKAAVMLDTGTLHIACALKKPSVGVFAMFSPEQWAPRIYCYPVSLNLPCINCDKGKNCKISHRCMNGITSSMIIDQLKKLYIIIMHSFLEVYSVTFLLSKS